MGQARPPRARAADFGVPPAPPPRGRRRRRSEAPGPDDAWLEMLADDDGLPGTLPDDPTPGWWPDQAEVAHDPPPPWSSGSSPDPSQAGGLPWGDGSVLGWFERGDEPSSNGHAAWAEQLEPPPPPPTSNLPHAWADEPTAAGAPDLYASWPWAPDGHPPGARDADPGGPSWDRPEGWPAPPGPLTDPPTDPVRAANPAMPAWDYPTQPGVPPLPEPWAYPGHPRDPRPPRAVGAAPAPGTAAAAWTPLDDVELPESRVDRFGDDHLHRRSGRGQARAGFWAEVPVLVVAAVVLAVLVKGFLVQAFYIPSRSMQPTLDVGDRVVVNRMSYRFGSPQRGQVVVFLRQTGGRVATAESPLSWARRAVAQGLGGAPPGSEDLIKRVIAGPGDLVQGSRGRVWVNGRAVAEPYLRRGSFTSDFGPLTVPPGHYWVMGDNREDSSDSRVFGPIPRSALVGRAVGTVWPPQRLGRL